MYNYIVSSHVNQYLSGVARFNIMLADKIGAKCIPIDKLTEVKEGNLLFSLKIADCTEAEKKFLEESIAYLVKNNLKYDIFLHSFNFMDIEYLILENASRIFAGNDEIYHSLEGLNRKLIKAWCPYLFDLDNRLYECELNLFSFGMAHKIQIRYYEMLKQILDRYKVDYLLWVSSAFHEKANFGDFPHISRQLHSIFGQNIQFLGFLSDEALNYFLHKCRLFIAFFPKGVRANNTSVFAAMKGGCAVLTNCDEYSPSWFEHGRNILDINKLSPNELNVAFLEKIAQRAIKDIKKFAEWENLIKLMSDNR